MNLFDGDGPDNGRHRLRARVTARARYQGDEAVQDDGGGEYRAFKGSDDAARQQRGHEEQQQPDDALAHHVPDGDGEIGVLQRLGTTQPLDVLGRFFFEDVKNIVYGYDAEQPVLLVHYRHGYEVVAGDKLGQLFLVRIHPDGDDVPIHDRLDGRVRPGQHQV